MTFSCVANWHGDWGAGIDNGGAANQTVGWLHGDGTDDVIAEVLSNLKSHLENAFAFALAGEVYFGEEGVVNFWESIRRKLHVHNSAHNLDDTSGGDSLRIVYCSHCYSLLCPEQEGRLALTQAVSARDNFCDFGGDFSLTRVVSQARVGLNQVARVFRCGVHRLLACRKFGSCRHQHD